MSNNNSTLFPLNSLPVSKYRLLDFHSFQHLRGNPLESVFIQPPPGKTGFGTDGDLFKYPIQFAILGVSGNQVDLGVYAHPLLQVRRGPTPNKVWRRKWKKTTIRWAANTGVPSDIRSLLIPLCDEAYRLRSLHLYCYECLDHFLNREGHDQDPCFLSGLRQFFHWLIEQDRAFCESLERLRRSGGNVPLLLTNPSRSDASLG